MSASSSVISLLFHCKVCKITFEKVYQFIEHKKRHHFLEFRNIRSIVFEEKTDNINQFNLPIDSTTANYIVGSSASALDPQEKPNTDLDPLKKQHENKDKIPAESTVIPGPIPVPKQHSLSNISALSRSGNPVIIAPPAETQGKRPDPIVSVNTINSTQSPSQNPNLLYVIIRRSRLPSASTSSSIMQHQLSTQFSSDHSTTSGSTSEPGFASALVPSSVCTTVMPFVDNTNTKTAVQSITQTNQTPKNASSAQVVDPYNPDEDPTSDSDSNSETAMDSDTINEIQSYLDEIQEERPFVCDVCERRYRSQADLNYHIKTHSDDKPYKCPHSECSLSFKRKSNLNLHKKRHTDAKPYKCSHAKCQKAFKSKTDLKNHQARHLADKKFKCPEANCDKIFYSHSSVRFHVNSKHRLGEHPPEYTCFVCQKTFYYKSTFENHFASHRVERPFKCDKEGCSSSFKLKTQLVQHEQFVHNGVQKSQECELCGKAYSTPSTLKRHMYIVHKTK